METPRPDELASLRAELAAQRSEIAALKRRPRLSFPRRAKALAAAGLLVALTPLATIAANPTFSDLGTAAPVHQGNIQAIGNAGITTGFEDPANPGQRTYNPKGNVTREEMASFLARTAGLNGNPPVVNAQTAVTAQTATSATTAANATTVGGYAPDGLVRVARVTVPSNVETTPVQTITVTAAYPAAYQEVGRVTITAPSDGYVLLTAQAIGTAYTDSGIVVRLRDLATNETSPPIGQQIQVSNNQTAINVALSPSYTFPVAAGARTFVLEASARTANPQFPSEVASIAINALYTPFGNVTTATTP